MGTVLKTNKFSALVYLFQFWSVLLTGFCAKPNIIMIVADDMVGNFTDHGLNIRTMLELLSSVSIF